MKYYFETLIDCKACLDAALLNLLPIRKTILSFRESEDCYEIIMDSDETLETVKRMLADNKDISIEIRTAREVDEVDLSNLGSGFTTYTESFWAEG